MDEEAEGVWGYLIPLDASAGDTLVLRKRTACPAPEPSEDFGSGAKSRESKPTGKKTYQIQEEMYEERKRIY